MDDAAATGRLLDLSEADKVSNTVIKNLNDLIFADPSKVTGASKGIRWIDEEFLEATGVTRVKEAEQQALGAWSAIGKAGGTLLDVNNDIQRALYLYLNPAYGPVQLLQNSLMLMMSEQSPFAIKKIGKAWMLNHQLDETSLAKLDSLMQLDILVNARVSRSVVKGAVTPLAKLQTTIGDLGPRRASFLISAEKAGYKTPEEITNLLNDKDKFKELDLITRRANKAVGDFEAMGDIEKSVMTRVFWFWPWTRVAWSYSTRFALDHPMQAAALAAATYAGYQEQQNELGDVPFYGTFYMPLERFGFPGDIINVGPLTPFAGPIQDLQTAAALVTGNEDAPSVGDRLTPGFTQALNLIRPERGGTRGVRSLVDPYVESPAIQRPKALLRSDEEREKDNEKKIRPTTKAEDALRFIVAGSLYKSGYNKESVAAQGPKRSEEAREHELRSKKMEFYSKETGRPIPKSAVEASRRVRNMDRQLRLLEKKNKDGITMKARAMVARRFYLSVKPTAKASVERAFRGATTESDWERIYGVMRRALAKPYSGVTEKVKDEDVGE
jgi:hypothetical protein